MSETSSKANVFEQIASLASRHELSKVRGVFFAPAETATALREQHLYYEEKDQFFDISPTHCWCRATKMGASRLRRDCLRQRGMPGCGHP